MKICGKEKNHLLKGIVSFVLCTSILLSMNIFVSAAKVGDIVGKAVYTDIVAKINEYDIASFNINGETAIVVEDLRNYGCDVQWDENNRTLNITRANTSKVASTYVAPAVSKSKIGKKAHNVLYSDIKTYVNGHLIPSYNIGGKTIINIESLVGRIGHVHWDEKSRVITLTVSGLDRKPSTSAYYPSYSSNTSSAPSYSGTGYSYSAGSSLSSGYSDSNRIYYGTSTSYSKIAYTIKDNRIYYGTSTSYSKIAYTIKDNRIYYGTSTSYSKIAYTIEDNRIYYGTSTSYSKIAYTIKDNRIYYGTSTSYSKIAYTRG